MSEGAVIASLLPGSKAEQAGLQVGDRILTVNGVAPQDLIDLSFELAESRILLEVQKTSGERQQLTIRKKADESMGFELESAVFDRVRTCGNHCVFCFVDQMPAGLRASLYVKDDDYRLSFLYGNFVTLTNFAESDFDRVRRFHLSPLYISVHTTDGELRKNMLGSPQAARIMQWLERLAAVGVEMHTQAVLCPDLNDGNVMLKTIQELAALRPAVLSLALVPVGLTRFRQDCPPLREFSSEEAVQIVERVEALQTGFRAESGHSFVYLSDEFYLKAGKKIPPEEWYDGYPQLENGIGMVRSFLTDWNEAKVQQPLVAENISAGRTLLISGTAFAPVLSAMVSAYGGSITVQAIHNRFFGPAVNVTGLLTGGDILTQLKGCQVAVDRVILPVTALRKNETVFLDGMSVAELQKELAIPVEIVNGAADLRQRLGGEPR